MTKAHGYYCWEDYFVAFALSPMNGTVYLTELNQKMKM